MYALCHLGDCLPGYWCVYGNDRATPNGPNSTYNATDSCFDGQQLGYGGICPLGHYCPGGVASTFPIPCENGTYADEEGLDACKTCPQGEDMLFHSFPRACIFSNLCDIFCAQDTGVHWKRPTTPTSRALLAFSVQTVHDFGMRTLVQQVRDL